MSEYDETLLEMTGNKSDDGKTMKVEMTALAEGESPFSASILSGKASCMVKVNDSSSVAGIETGNAALTIRDGIVTAEGCAVTVYDINGRALISGHDSVDTASLAAGIYVAAATDKAGRTAALKFAK